MSSKSLQSKMAKHHFTLVASTALIMVGKLPVPKRVRKFAEITTLHGIRDLLSGGESRLFKAMWSLVIVLAAAFLFYELTQLVITFIQEPIATNIQLQRLTRRELADIVTPYACLTDWISKSRAVAKNYSQAALLALNAFANPAVATFIYSNEPRYQELKMEARRLIKMYQNELMQTGRTLEYYYEPLRKNYPFLRPSRHGENRQNYLIFTNAVCFPMVIENATDVVGVPIFRAVLDLMKNDTFNDALYKEIHQTGEDHLTIMFYHGQNMRYLSEIDKIHIDYSPELPPRQINLRMRFKRLDHIPRRAVACVDYPTEEKDSKYPVSYVRQLCMQRCMDLIYVQKYNCTFRKPRTNRQVNVSYVNVNKELPLCTAEKFFAKDFSKKERFQMHKCQDGCESWPHFCKEWDIDVERQRWVIPRNCSYEGCLNVAIVAQPTLEVSEELFLMSFDTFLSNLGGQAGLWFGGSILSIVQILFFCIMHGWSVKKLRKLSRHTPPPPPKLPEIRQARLASAENYDDALLGDVDNKKKHKRGAKRNVISQNGR